MGRRGLAKEVRQEEAGKGGAFSQASLWVLPGAGIGQGEDSVLGVHTLPLNTCVFLPGPEEDQCSYSGHGSVHLLGGIWGLLVLQVSA